MRRVSRSRGGPPPIGWDGLKDPTVIAAFVGLFGVLFATGATTSWFGLSDDNEPGTAASGAPAALPSGWTVSTVERRVWEAGQAMGA